MSRETEFVCSLTANHEKLGCPDVYFGHQAVGVSIQDIVDKIKEYDTDLYLVVDEDQQFSLHRLLPEKK